MKTELESTQTDSKRLREEMNILKNTVQQVIFCENVNNLSINKGLSRCFGKKVPFWEIFNRRIGHLGIKIRGLEWKFWEFYMILEYFSLGKGLFTGRWWMRGKIPDQWPNLRLILHTPGSEGNTYPRYDRGYHLRSYFHIFVRGELLCPLL